MQISIRTRSFFDERKRICAFYSTGLSLILMNRTLTYASLHAINAFRTNIRSSICWSCSVTKHLSQRTQYHVLRPSPHNILRTSTRCLSTKRMKKEKNPYVSKKIRTNFPLLQGESPPPPRRSKDRIPAEKKDRRASSRESIERARLDTIANRSKKETTETMQIIKKTPISERKVPSPQRSGLYSSSNTFSNCNLTL